MRPATRNFPSARRTARVIIYRSIREDYTIRPLGVMRLQMAPGECWGNGLSHICMEINTSLLGGRNRVEVCDIDALLKRQFRVKHT